MTPAERLALVEFWAALESVSTEHSLIQPAVALARKHAAVLADIALEVDAKLAEWEATRAAKGKSRMWVDGPDTPERLHKAEASPVHGVEVLADHGGGVRTVLLVAPQGVHYNPVSEFDYQNAEGPSTWESVRHDPVRRAQFVEGIPLMEDLQATVLGEPEWRRYLFVRGDHTCPTLNNCKMAWCGNAADCQICGGDCPDSRKGGPL